MVSARKTKARLDDKKLAELKSKNIEKQKELSLSADEARALSDELVKSAISGFERELSKSSPAVKQLAANLSGMMKEFFIGFKQGVDAELNTFVKDTSKTLSKANDKLVEEVVSSSKDIEEAVKDQLEPLKEKTETKLAIADVLARKDGADGASKTVLGKTGNIKDWLTRAGLGAIGMEDYAEKVVGERQKKEAFIKTETKLRADEFQGMDPKEVRAKLEADFKTISETTKKLKDIEEQISAYKELGYSEEQIKKIGVDKDKEELTKTLIAADPSRLGKYKGTETPLSPVPAQVPTTESPLKTVPAPVNEEVAMEQAAMEEEAAKQRESQTTLLSEIRDILKAPKPQTNAAAPAGEGGPSLPDIDLPGRSRGSILKNAGRSALNVAKKAAPWAIAGAVMLGGINAVDAGLGKLGVGKDKDGNDLAIDENQDNANWEKMSTGGKIMSGAARGIEKVGSFLGLDSITRAARADRIKSETEYLKGKEATVQDVKTATSEVQQNRVESQSSKLSELEQKRANIAAMATPGESAAVTKGREKALAAIDREIEREKSGSSAGGQPTPQTNAKEYMIDSRQIPVPVEQKGFFSGLLDKAKNFFGMGAAPSVEATTQPQGKTEPSKLSELEQKRANIVAMATPGESAAVTKGREKALAAIDREIEREKSAPTPSTTPTSLQKTSGQSWAPAPSTPPATAATNTSIGAPLAASAKDKKVQEEAAKLGITGKVTGIFEAGVLTKIKETETGKVHDVALTGEDKQKVEAIRIHRGMNGENTNKLQEASIAGENGVTKPLPASVKEATPDASAKQTAAEIGKNIVVQSPPVVVSGNGGGQSQTVAPTFTNNTRNRDPSISDYLRSRYA